MREIAAVELSLVVNELKGIAGSFLRKFYEVSEDAFRMNFYSQSEGGKIDVFISLNKTINITAYTEHAGEPTGFAMSIRKRIEGRRLASIEQIGMDRIIEMDFSGSEGYKLIVEMFGKGNMILVNGSMSIESAYRFVKYKEREITRGSAYAFPTGEQRRIWDIDKEYIAKKLEELREGEQAIRELSRCFNFGPLYVEDILLRCGLDPRTPLKREHYKAIGDGVYEFIEKARHPSPSVYVRSGKYIDYSVVPLKKYEGVEAVRFNTVSEMLDSFYLEERRSSAKGEEPEGGRKRKEIELSIEKQKKIAEEMRSEAEESRKSANAIFKHINEINQLIMMLKENEKVPIDKLNKNFKDIKVKSIDLKRKKVKIQLEDG
ncbi:MAG: NFACT family protein [Candidatus Micrarchaeia archaeon]